MTNLVAWTIDTISTNWSTSNYDPQPELINKDDSEPQSTGQRKTAWDLSKNNAVTVSDSPDRQTEPIGTEFNHRVTDGVAIKIEAMPSDKYGHVTDSKEFQPLVREVKRCLLVERVWPLRDPDAREYYHTLDIKNEVNESHLYKDLYRVSFDVQFQGHEDLPDN
jgi:hypothetical protein